ncbi:DUF4892 domain-containing protein [Pseudomonas sp. HR96]|uniref:DUF4892 domain-containing protein n=1 Tax=Pseudomonas sp. HR96 TaxID=1027966 RepID=UPI002A7636B7|nr:DUF4892 domain-containing protein [Pseudomonas sp. HR96]WPO98584.1 DUF4892 domain-containing protein [Pseudomonas sp. HR96]
MSLFSRLPWLALALPLAWAGLSQAASLDALAPADATVVDPRATSQQDRVYPMGAVRKISGQLRMDAQVAGKGELTSFTWELPAEHSAVQAFTTARTALQAEGAQLLYWCEARECGESSLWANEIFGNSRLYGADEQQAFLLLRRAAPDDNQLVALYSITRGNRRAYLHAEQWQGNLPLGELLPTSGTVLRELRSTGVLDYPALAGEPSPNWSALLARTLNQDVTMRVSLSGAHADAWRQALAAAGVRAARLEDGTTDTPGLHVEWLR